MTDKQAQKGMRLHRCFSDGFLLSFSNNHSPQQINETVKYASDLCVNGNVDINMENAPADVNGHIDEHLSLVNDLSPVCEAVRNDINTDLKEENVTEKACDQNCSFANQLSVNSPNGHSNLKVTNSAAGDIVRPKTWSRRAAEKMWKRCKGKKEAETSTTKLNVLEIGVESTTDMCHQAGSCELNGVDTQQNEGIANGASTSNECNIITMQKKDILLVRNPDNILNDKDETPGCVEFSPYLENGIDSIPKIFVKNKITCNNTVNSEAMYKEHNMSSGCSNRSSMHLQRSNIVAPLATPEYMSDDARYHSDDSCDNNEHCKVLENNIKLQEVAKSLEVALGSERGDKSNASPNTAEPIPCRDSECNQTCATENNASVTCDSGDEVLQTVGEHSAEPVVCEPYENNECSEHVDDSDCHDGACAALCDTERFMAINYLGNNSNTMNRNVPRSPPSSLGSLEDVGDYIEADLPPNVEMVAFFSRGASSSTTTDEDEGCGDEVLVNNDEESENETIDPLGDMDSASMRQDHDRYTGNHQFSPLSQRNRQYPQSLDKEVSSSDDDNRERGNGLLSACDNGETCDLGIGECFSDSGSNNEGNVEGMQRQHNVIGPFRSDNITRMLWGMEEEDSVTTSDTTTHRQSSGSEPLGRPCSESDVSEELSSQAEPGLDSDFSEKTFAQYEQFEFDQNPNVFENHRANNWQNHTLDRTPFSLERQAVSLDYDTSEEVLFCPFYNRRSRSLDQELAAAPPEQRSLEPPNIRVSSSNFQNDEVNQQEKVFEKRALHMPPPLPTCDSSDSSDDEDNLRVPGFRSADNPAFAGVDGAANQLEFDSTHTARVKEEPIYEDIDDLELLLEEVADEDEHDNNSPRTQPITKAISKLRCGRRCRSPVNDVEKVMIWNEYEAYVVQVKQIGTSACGPTAVLNVLKAFDFQVDKEEVCQTITHNTRMEAAPIPYYLFSRSAAGTTAQALVAGMAQVTRGAIKGRFFHFYPQRDVELLKWLGHWMKKGAVPVATLNLQRGVKPGWTIPDAWHHQMVYAVGSKGVYLTNPLEIVPENVIMEQLTSDSVLMVRRQDVLSRFRDWCPLNELLKQRDVRWRTMNVLGQVVHMLRENSSAPQESGHGLRGQLSSHICIPAVYMAGIILFMRANTDTYQELLTAPELPVKSTDKQKTKS